MATKPKLPVSVYLSYAQKDGELKQAFEDYLVIMQQNGLISGWVERQVQQGTDWSQVIDPRLLTADLSKPFTCNASARQAIGCSKMVVCSISENGPPVHIVKKRASARPPRRTRTHIHEGRLPE